ncbi:MAG: RNase H-like domain-containing protein [Pseudomonadota bacterium]
MQLKSFPFWGHVISTEGIKPDPKKLKAISKMELPKTLTQLRSALGLFSYYRKFVRNFSKIASPLTMLTATGKRNKKGDNGKIIYDEKAKKSFEALKHLLADEPICLAHPDWSKPFEVHPDACKTGLGAVLTQKTDTGERVVMYASRSTNGLEKNYLPYELEALAMVWAIELFRHYLYGRKFIVRTDHRALKWLMKREHGTRVTRWVMRLQEYDFEVFHRAGTASSNADGLSRNPLPSTNPYGEDDIEPLYCNVATGSGEQKPSAGLPDGTLFGGCGGHCLSADGVEAPKDDHERREGSFELRLVKDYYEAENKQEWFKETFLKYKDESYSKLVTNENFYEKDGLVYLDVRKKPVKKVGEERVDKLVVPQKLVDFVLYLHHNTLLNSHQGRKRTLSAISRRFYWKRMSQDCRAWVKACVPCKRRKTPRPMKLGYTHPMFKNRPFHTVAIDLVGPCPETRDGDVWILTMMDVFTRWPIAVPLPNRKSETIMKALYENLFSAHGMPCCILSDRGKEFIDSGLRRLCNWLGVNKIATTGYQPQANGHVERFHRFLNAAMTIVAKGSVSKWDWYLPSILFSYRVGECDSTGFSPFLLMSGIPPVLPVDLLLETNKMEFYNENDYASELASVMTRAYEYVRVKQHEVAYMNALRRDEGRSPIEYKAGDPVFYWYDKTSEKSSHEHDVGRVTTPSKWRNWWHPATVVDKVNGNVYVIELDGKRVNANVNRLVAKDVYSRDVSWVEKAGDLPECDGPSFVPNNAEDASEPVSVGQLVVFPMKGGTFGMGKVLKKTGKKLNLQWYGNFHDVCGGTYRPCWYQASQLKYYYKEKPAHYSHPPYTTDDTDTVVKVDDIIINNFTLEDNDKLSAECLRIVQSDKHITYHEGK